MIRTFLLLIMAMAALSVHGQVRFTYAEMQSVLRSFYLQDVSQELTTFENLDQMQAVYGYFMPENQRAAFFGNWKKRAQVTIDRDSFLITVPGRPQFRLQVTNILRHEFQINGQPYVQDWSGDMVAQRDRMRYLFKHKRSAWNDLSPLQFLLPQAEAQGWEEVVVAACVEGGCELAVTLAERASVQMLARAAIARGLSVSVETAAKKEIEAALTEGGEVATKYVVRIGKDLPKVASAVKSGGAAIKNKLVSGVKWLGHAVNEGKWPISFSVGTVFGPYFATAYSQAAGQKIPLSTGLHCALHGYVIDATCPYASPKVEINSGATNSIQTNWCSTPKINESSIAVARGDGTKVVFIKQNATEGPNKGKTLSIVRYETNLKTNQVMLDSVRQFDVDNDHVVRITKPNLSPNPIIVNDVWAAANPNLSDPDLLDSDMQKQIDRRSATWKAHEIGPPVEVANAELVKKLMGDPLEARKNDLEKDAVWAKNSEDAIGSIDQICNAKQQNAVTIKDKLTPDPTGSAK